MLLDDRQAAPGILLPDGETDVQESNAVAQGVPFVIGAEIHRDHRLQGFDGEAAPGVVPPHRARDGRQHESLIVAPIASWTRRRFPERDADAVDPPRHSRRALAIGS